MGYGPRARLVFYVAIAISLALALGFASMGINAALRPLTLTPPSGREYEVFEEHRACYVRCLQSPGSFWLVASGFSALIALALALALRLWEKYRAGIAEGA